MDREKGHAPILVTGAHRSGTTWVGKMLAVSSDVTYISEPLNVYHRPGVLSEPVDHWYQYICKENQSTILPAFSDTLHYRYHYRLELKSLGSIKDIGRMLRDAGMFVDGRLRGTRALIKDPFAIFSAPWFAHQFGCRIVIVVRHPLAFVSSLKRLGWDFNFEDLLAQPLLMRDYLAPFRDEMMAEPEDIIAQGSLLWRMVYNVVNGFRESHPEFLITRHEDLSRDPIFEFQNFYESLGLAFTPKVQRIIENSSQRSNPEELSEQRVHAVKLDSQANLSNWQKRLTKDEIDRIGQLTSDIASKFYPEEFWE